MPPSWPGRKRRVRISKGPPLPARGSSAPCPMRTRDDSGTCVPRARRCTAAARLGPRSPPCHSPSICLCESLPDSGNRPSDRPLACGSKSGLIILRAGRGNNVNDCDSMLSGLRAGATDRAGWPAALWASAPVPSHSPPSGIATPSPTESSGPQGQARAGAPGCAPPTGKFRQPHHRQGTFDGRRHLGRPGWQAARALQRD